MVTFVENFILGISLTLPLGPVTLEILRRGITLGYFHSLRTAIGAFSAELVFFTIVYLGLSSIYDHFLIKYGLGLLGIVFLLFLGYENVKEYFKKTNAFSSKILKKNSFTAGFLITFLNPLNVFMWVGIIGAFFATSENLFVATGVLYGILISLIMITLLSIAGKHFIKTNKMKYVSLIAGLFLIYYALKLLINLVTSF